MKKLSSGKISSWAAVLVVAAVVVAPIGASAATDSGSVEATVASVIAVNSTNTVAIGVTPTSAGAEATANDSVSVDSNDSDGYNLTFSSSDGAATMAGFKDDGTTTNGASLAVTSGTFGTPASLSANSWGWRVDNLGTFGAAGTTTYAGVPINTAAQNIRSTTTTASAEVTTVKYAVKVDLTKPNGIYKDTVTYTATAK